jgi:hypothetical protein
VHVNQHEYKTIIAPNELETCGVGPCIAVAIIFQNRGFLFHTPHLYFDEDSIVEPFLQDVHSFISTTKRKMILPVIVGGSFETTKVRGVDIADINEMTADCRIDVQQLLLVAGFGEPRIRWGRPNESQNLRCDLGKALVHWSTDYIAPKRRPTVHHRPLVF